MHRTLTVADGLRVHVAEAGAGEPVVLQHGWPQHWWVWRHLIPPLARRHRVICPDLRGHGWSDAPPGGYEKEQLATDLIGVLDALGLERVRLVGHDWGGFAAFLAGIRAPERFSHIVALSIAHPWPAPGSADLRQLARGWYQGLLASPGLGRAAVQRLGFVERALQASRVAGSYTDEELEVYGERFRDPARAQATVQLYRTFLTRELRPLADGAYRGRRLTVPARLIVGAQDGVLKDNPLDGWQGEADDMAIERLAGLSHWLPEEAPDVVLDRLEAFL
jgi:pimeloyl-ACP methyl ester carboxylesterase